METVDASHMRAMNCSILLKLIWKHHRISRADISRMTGMSRSTVSAIVSELMDRGLVKELGIGPSNGGRRPMMLAFQEDAFSILGLHISAHSIAAMTMNLNGVMRRWFVQPCAVFASPDAAFDLLNRIIDDTAAQALKVGTPLVGLAFACPQQPRGTAEDLDFAEWEAKLKSLVNIPVYRESDANFGALAELWWNVDSQPRHLGYFELDETLSFGLMTRDNRQEQSFGVSGHLGKLLVSSACASNLLSTRSLDQLASGNHLVEAAREFLPKDGLTSVADIFAAAIAGNSVAEQILDRAAAPLAMTLYNTQALLQLDRVVIGGLWRQETVRLGQQLEKLQDLHGPASHLSIQEWLVPSFRGDQQIALGAGTRVLEKVMEDLSLFPAKCADQDTLAEELLDQRSVFVE